MWWGESERKPTICGMHCLVLIDLLLLSDGCLSRILAMVDADFGSKTMGSAPPFSN